MRYCPEPVSFSASLLAPMEGAGENLGLRGSPSALSGRMQAKTARSGPLYRADFLKKIGAGEGIRTLDPNLGKVVLYP